MTATTRFGWLTVPCWHCCCCPVDLPCCQLFSLLDMHVQISLALPLLSKMLTPPQPGPTSRRSSGGGSTTGPAAAGGAAVGVAAGTALVDGLWELQQLVAGSALGLFNEYEGVVSRDGNKMLPADGTIHPLTAQVLSYVKVCVSQGCVRDGKGPSRPHCDAQVAPQQRLDVTQELTGLPLLLLLLRLRLLLLCLLLLRLLRLLLLSCTTEAADLQVCCIHPVRPAAPPGATPVPLSRRGG